jgi:hypothetical protein
LDPKGGDPGGMNRLKGSDGRAGARGTSSLAQVCLLNEVLELVVQRMRIEAVVACHVPRNEPERQYEADKQAHDSQHTPEIVIAQLTEQASG